MSRFSEFLRFRRNELQLGLREACRLTERHAIPESISPTYLSRLESGAGPYVDAEKITLDKLWAVGCALRVSPLLLFCLSREIDMREFSVINSDPVAFCDYILTRRRDMGFSLRDVSMRADRLGMAISTGFLSQVENDFRGQAGKISGDKLWIIGCIYDIDPLLLFVLSRNLHPKLCNASNRDMLFS